MNGIFESYLNAKEEANKIVKQLNQELEEKKITTSQFNSLINSSYAKYKDSLKSNLNVARNYIKGALDIDINLYTVIKGRDALFNVIDTTVLKNKTELDEDIKKIKYKLNNQTSISDTQKSQINIACEIIILYHEILFKDAPKREVIPEEEIKQKTNSKNLSELKKEDSNSKEPKKKANFFIKFLPTIIGIIVIIGFVIYYYIQNS